MNNKYIIKLLYILQTFEYDLNSFSKYSIRPQIHTNKFQYKDKLVYTPKIKILLILTLILEIFSSIEISFYINLNIIDKLILFVVILILIYEILTPFFIYFTTLLIYPVEYTIKNSQIRKAKKKVSTVPNLKVIAVIGSYGKTSTVNFIKTLLSFDYKVFTPGKSINTILGISQSINNNMDSNTEILLLEIGAYKVGEIKEVMKNFPSDISIITSFGTQHLERFKSTTNIIKAGIEVVDFAKKNAKIIAPKDIYNIPFEQYDIDIKFDENKEYITTSYKIDKIEGGVTYFKTNFSEDMFHTTLLGYSMISNLTLAIKTAELFNITNIQGKINIIKPTDRRMYPIYINDVLYIDDTYNIGEESAKSDINFIYDLKKKGIVKRIFVVTGGIVERGKESEKVNTEYGKFLSKIIDGVYIFNTPFKKYIKNGIKVLDKAVEIENYMDFEKYKKDFKKGDCILMQNEITDQYYFKS